MKDNICFNSTDNVRLASYIDPLQCGAKDNKLADFCSAAQLFSETKTDSKLRNSFIPYCLNHYD